MTDNQVRKIEGAIEEIRKGNLVIVSDDEHRENEGDFIAAADGITPEMVNFMATHGRGLICCAIPDARCKELDLPMMVSNNTSSHETAFTVSVDLIGQGCTTGISASDRAKTINALVNPDTKPSELGRPGHIFPLRAKEKGVLRRAGHTETTVDLTRMAGLKPGGALVEIMNEDGTMARLPELMEIAKKFNLKIFSVADLIRYRLQKETIIEKGTQVTLPTQHGEFQLIPYRQTSNGLEHVALVKGTWTENEPVLVRVHSSCITGDIFGSLRCDCGPQLQKAMEMVDNEGKGVIVYLNQEGRGIGLFHKIQAYKLQEEGKDTVEANIELGFKPDERDFGVGASILHDLKLTHIKLITNNPIKRVGLEGYGINIIENIPLHIRPNKFNKKYIETKHEKMGHSIENSVLINPKKE